MSHTLSISFTDQSGSRKGNKRSKNQLRDRAGRGEKLRNIAEGRQKLKRKPPRQDKFIWGKPEGQISLNPYIKDKLGVNLQIAPKKPAYDYAHNQYINNMNDYNYNNHHIANQQVGLNGFMPNNNNNVPLENALIFSSIILVILAIIIGCCVFLCASFIGYKYIANIGKQTKKPYECQDDNIVQSV